MEDEDEPAFRRIVVNAGGHGMRLDRFLSARFAGRSRAWMAKGIREGRVTLSAGALLGVVVEGVGPGGTALARAGLVDLRVVVRAPALGSWPGCG